jgi:hypothetical protein
MVWDCLNAQSRELGPLTGGIIGALSMWLSQLLRNDDTESLTRIRDIIGAHFEIFMHLLRTFGLQNFNFKPRVNLLKQIGDFKNNPKNRISRPFEIFYFTTDEAQAVRKTLIYVSIVTALDSAEIPLTLALLAEIEHCLF